MYSVVAVVPPFCEKNSNLHCTTYIIYDTFNSETFDEDVHAITQHNMINNILLECSA